ncbi:3-hydroxyacyl-CoA dehydrogenase [Verminephrobacter eiseniae]|uniref:3-hydroxyacyl-CoA dehydrogenase n=1 Tax=Verminephrobacter eiseniae TaxID=364317 RepID=UPI0022374605|nr:3-hydroxyacyl-CoA dehydrogenase [Verminephrobacter eiseniae]MCW5262231.1 3-hydroxyacyl-CoA dehydrogenase [Verminephrobacter eiseniae]
MSYVNHLTVLGAGVLGGQITWHSAFKGKSVVVYDISEEALTRCRAAQAHYAAIYQTEAVGASEADVAGARQRLTFTTDLASAVASADLVIEAVPEIPQVKTSVYQQMAPLLPAHTLIATNSSTFLPSDFAAATGRPDKFCALHYANYIWAANLVEIMPHAATARTTLDDVTRFAIETGMVPIPVGKEHNGYVLNAWFAPLVTAAQALVTNGITTPEVVDRTFLIANPGARMGPMGMMDVVGMKTCYDVSMHWGQVLGDRQQLANAEYIKTHLMDKGRMGMLSGKGYYDYPNPAYEDAGFLSVPPLSQLSKIVDRCIPAA